MAGKPIGADRRRAGCGARWPHSRHENALVGGAPDDHFMVAPELAYLGKPVTMPPAEQVSDWIGYRLERQLPGGVRTR